MSTRWIIIVWRVFGLAGAVVIGATAYADEATCGSLRNGFGPFDYRTATADQRSTVEGPHFPLHVEMLLRGATSENLGHDIDFTLRAFPNHHRALQSMSKLGLRLGSVQPPGAQRTIECYFERAVRFRPDDPIPYVIAGLYYTKTKQHQTAVWYLDRARNLADDNPKLHYTLGLGYLDLMILDKSVEHAKRAYSGGIAVPELRERLRAAGAWTD